MVPSLTHPNSLDVANLSSLKQQHQPPPPLLLLLLRRRTVHWSGDRSGRHRSA
jgi:hypothetical protein